MNKKGQALVEFVLILPIFLMLIFLVIDFGMIFTKKLELENTSSSIIEDINNDMDLSVLKEKYPKLMLNISNSPSYQKITITSYIDLMTPGINKIMGDPYELVIERYIYNETK